MTALPHKGERRCVSCSCVLAADNHRRVCAPCLSTRDYDPRIDRRFPRLLAEYLSVNVGRVCSPCAHFGIRHDHEYVVHREVGRLRVRGWTIEGVRGVGFRVAAAPSLEQPTL